MNPLEREDFIEGLRAAIPRFRYLSEISPKPGEKVWVACRIPGGAALFIGWRHPTEEGHPWYIEKDGVTTKVHEEVPEYWFPLPK